MITMIWVIGVSFITCLASFFTFHVYFYRRQASLENNATKLERAKELFYWQREMLEAKFVSFAISRLDSNLWIWDEAEFGSHVLIAHSKRERAIFAYLPVTVEMNRPVRDMDLPKNDLFFRKVTVIAQFITTTDCWELTGHAVFNLSPIDVVQRRTQELQFIETLRNRAA